LPWTPAFAGVTAAPHFRLDSNMTETAIDGQPLLEVRGLRMHFPVTEGIIVHRKIGEVKAVDGINF